MFRNKKGTGRNQPPVIHQPQLPRRYELLVAIDGVVCPTLGRVGPSSIL